MDPAPKTASGPSAPAATSECAALPATSATMASRRLNVLQLQRYIRNIPKPVIAVVPGFAIGGGHVLHVCCDLTISSDNAIYGQTGPIVGSFDAGFGSSFLAAHIGQKKAREIWFLCRQYSAAEAEEMGMVNTVVPLADLEQEALQWSREILSKSPIALRFIKAGLNAELDGQNRSAGLGWRRNHALLHDGRRQRRQKRLPRRAQTRLQQVPAPGLGASAEPEKSCLAPLETSHRPRTQ